MQDDIDLMKPIAEANATISCDKIPDKPLCIDLFIKESRAAVFGGDDRDFDPYAGHAASRVQVFIDPTDPANWEVKINTSKITWGSSVVWERDDSARLFKADSDVAIRFGANNHDTLYVHLKFYNNFCPSRAICNAAWHVAIDADLVFVADPTAPGGYQVGWKRDGFPSMGIYHLGADGQTYTKIREDPERFNSSWFGWMALMGKLEQELELPPGCNLQ